MLRTAVTTFLLAAFLGVARADGDDPYEHSLKKGIPIFVPERAGLARHREPVTFAFPLPADAKVKNVKKLYVTDADGDAVPAQFRALQRYGGGPDEKKRPIRWVLVDLQIDVAADSTAKYWLHKGKPKKAKAPRLKVKKLGSDGVRIDTGVARFEIDPDLGFLSKIAVDQDGDGKAKSDDEVILDRPVVAGVVLEDRFGALYSSRNWPATITVEEKGPLRTVIRVDGRHGPVVEDVGIGRDFLKYRTRYTFHAGKPWVRIQHAIKNSYLDDPLGSIGFESYSLVLSLNADGKAEYTARVGAGGAEETGAPGLLSLYQDTDGGPKWNTYANASFSGFRVYGEGLAVIDSGAQASGWISVDGPDHGLTIAVRHFYENFPKGFTFDGDRAISVDLFPKAYASFHWLDDGQQKTTDLLVCAQGAQEVEPAALATAFQNEIHPYADPEWTRRAKAWGDLGDLDDPEPADATLIAYDDGQYAGLYNGSLNKTSYAFGWADWGEPIWAKNTHTTGSPRNKLTYFDKFAVLGSQSAFRINEIFALHSRDIRTYHIDGFTKEKRPKATLWEALPVWSLSEDKLGRDALDPALAPHRAGIPATGHGWNAFDFEHMVVDDVYEHYLLTGDWFSLDALRDIAECMRTWLIYDPKKQPGSSRGVGWTLRALMKCWQVTGDPRYLASADAIVTAVNNTYGGAQEPSPVTGIKYAYITRYTPLATHIATAEYDLPWQLGATIHGLMLHHHETGASVSRKLALDVADYLVDHCWNGVAFNEAVACDDPSVVNYKGDNTGVNLWLPSALAVVYREKPRPEYLQYATYMYTSISSLTPWNTYNGYGLSHWWHGYRALILGY